MRWPFMNWLRGAPGGDDPAPGAPEAAPAEASDFRPGARVEARPAAWRELPPVQRTVGDVPLTAPSTAFARDLASRRAPDPILRPLGHDVTADGPGGLVSGIAVPLVQRAPSGSEPQVTQPLPKPMVPGRGRPTTQRAATTVATLPGRGVPGTGPGSSVDAPRPEDAGHDMPVDAAPGEPAGAAPGPALRVLPVARLATEASGIAATRVADATAPLPIQALARVVAPEFPPRRDGGTSRSLPPAIVPDEAATAAPEHAEPAPGVRPNVAEVAPYERSRTDEPALPIVARRTLGESRRLGLGAPLVGPPPSAAREGGRSDLPVARRARSVDAVLSTPALLPALPAMAPAAAANAPLSRLVVARRSAGAPVTTIAPAPVASTPIAEPEAPGAAGAQALADGAPSGVPAGSNGDAEASVDADAAATPGSAAGPTRPLVGESPIGVARLAREDSGTVADEEPDAEPGAGAYRPTGMSPGLSHASHPGATTTGIGPASAATLGGLGTAHGFDATDRAAVQRTTAAPGGDRPSGLVRTPPTMSPTPAMVPLVAARAMRPGPTASIATLSQRPTTDLAPVVARLAATPSDPRGGGVEASPGPLWADHPAALSAPRVAIQGEERPVVARAALSSGHGAASVVLSTLPLTRSAVGTAGPDAIPTGRPVGAVSWPGAGFTTVAPTPGPFVQRAVQIDEVAVTPGAPAAGGTDAGAPSAGQAGPTGASAAGAGGAGTDYEELAEHIYDRIRARLTTELLLDRERSGTLVDG